jgi:hypothetical protein
MHVGHQKKEVVGAVEVYELARLSDFLAVETDSIVSA